MAKLSPNPKILLPTCASSLKLKPKIFFKSKGKYINSKKIKNKVIKDPTHIDPIP